jgi:molecular chaperone GrpE
MSIQRTDTQNGGETAPNTENISETSTNEADSTQTDGQNSPVDGTTSGESAAEMPNSSENDEKETDSSVTSIENGDSEGVEVPNPAVSAEDPTENDSPDSGTVHLDQRIAELEAKSTDLAAQLADARDQLLRKAADVENFRKRMNQDKQNAIEFANQSLLVDIIPMIDDLERAIQSAQSSAELSEMPAGKLMIDGLVMIQKRLTGQLESKWGLKRFNSAGEPFDPNRHEAMFMEKSPDIEEPVVQEEFLKGYMLKDRVIRAAQVKVLMPGE